MEKPQAPLSGIRIIDFGHYIAGPLTGMLLADQGAEVVKIDRPGTERTPQDAVYNRNKKRITLNLKDAGDLATARALIQSADVVIENFRPGVMERLGLGTEAMTKLKPDLIYLSLPGFASTDTERANIRAFEGVVCAATGLYTDLQVLRRLLDSRPVYTPIPLGSTYGAIHGAIAVTLALYNREERGIGEVIEVPLTGAAMSAMAIINLVIDGQPKRFGMPAFTDEERAKLPEWRKAVAERGDAATQEIGRSLTGLGSTITGTVQTGDGKWVYFIAGGHSRNTRALLMTLGIYDELIAEGMVDVSVFENFDKDNNLADSSGWSREWHRKVTEKMKRVVATEPAAVWVERMTDVGVPAAVHETSYEWLHAPETDAAALTVEVDEPDFGGVRQIGVQTWLSSTDASYMQPKPAQSLGEDELAALLGNGGPSGGGVSLGDSAPILKGIRVLDLSNVLAGPASARTLAEYGAEVIKIDPPDPNFGPNVSCKFPIEVSPGKRSMILDVKSDAGRAIFYKLVKTADVVVHNFRPGVPSRMGIDYESLKAIKPELVYLNLTAFNGPRPGPWMERPGFDPLLQAATGIQLRYGGEGNPPILHGWASCIDYITGYSATFGAALALLRRKRGSSAGDVVTTSLAQGAQLVQIPLMMGAGNVQPGNEIHGQSAIGEHPLYRVYEASDGWLFLAGLHEDVDKLLAVEALNDLPELELYSGRDENQGLPTALNQDKRSGFHAEQGINDEETLGSALEARIKQQPAAAWIDAFNAAGLGAHRVDSLIEIAEEYMHSGTTAELQQSWNDGRSISWVRFEDHPVGGAVELAPPAYARLKNAPVQLLSPNPKQGYHTREILTEMGYGDEQIDGWLVDGVIKEELHRDYLPGSADSLA